MGWEGASLSYPHSSEAHLNSEGREGRKKTFYIVFREEEREDEWLQWQDDGVWMNMRGGGGRA